MSTLMSDIVILDRNSSELGRSFLKNTGLLAIRISLWARTSTFSGPTKNETSQPISLVNIYCIHSPNDLSPCQSWFLDCLEFNSEWASFILVSSFTGDAGTSMLFEFILRKNAFLSVHIQVHLHTRHKVWEKKSFWNRFYFYVYKYLRIVLKHECLNHYFVCHGINVFVNVFNFISSHLVTVHR